MQTAGKEGGRPFPLHLSQLPVLGKAGQDRLRRARVHVVGTGRIGSWVAMALAAAGVGCVSANDPQVVERENLGAFVFARVPDIGKEKVFALEEFFHGRPAFVFEPVVAPIESRLVDRCLGLSDLVICCANTLSGRLAAERKAIRYGKPVLQTAALDGRERLGGVLTLRLPENPWSACFGCYFPNDRRFPRGEGLLSTATIALAAFASNMAVQIITRVRSAVFKRHNLFQLNLETYELAGLAVRRRAKCRVCGGA